MGSKHMTERSARDRQPHLHHLHYLKLHQMCTNSGNPDPLHHRQRKNLPSIKACSEGSQTRAAQHIPAFRGHLHAGGVTKGYSHQHWAAVPRLPPSLQELPSRHLRHPPSPKDSLTEKPAGDQRQHCQQSKLPEASEQTLSHQREEQAGTYPPQGRVRAIQDQPGDLLITRHGLGMR